MTNATPDAGWDCHAHVFGPYCRYPLAAERSYTPPPATLGEYLATLGNLGLDHGVLVHPSAYGDDSRCVLDALRECPRLRGGLVLSGERPQALAGLRALGVRGLRFSHRSGSGSNFAGSAGLDDLRALAPAMAREGLHAELWTDCRALVDLEDLLRRLPVPVVIDHMGGFDVSSGTHSAGFQALLRLLGEGRVWVKLCVYRNLPDRSVPDAGEPFHHALLRANPEQLLWGSDWPHLRVDPPPSTKGLLDLAMRWTASPSQRSAILRDNPRRLYA